MKIIILGAGQVGGTLAEQLASEQNDITVVDTDAAILRGLQDRLDIRTVEGPASLPSTLERAGAADAELIIAVTNSDEINIVACQVAHSVFNSPKKIARIRDQDYLNYHSRLFEEAHIPIDVIIGPEQLVTQNIKQLIVNPGALQVLDFADGRVQLVVRRGTREPYALKTQQIKKREAIEREEQVAPHERGAMAEGICVRMCTAARTGATNARPTPPIRRASSRSHPR